ncbi:META domain-containing protein [Flavobacterium sp.]|uniref:META domain-containing protein n=1 Tax=Flavobacterium sp. TaxID=239 RepID=UPI002486EBCD|nr:META domain-containing protein [Flavobacterium sp.]MDI1318006.1 META domain-containing protein [Flavobacterium sp.]
MKSTLLLAVIILSVIVSGCNSTKTTETKKSASNASIYDSVWELEYITGPRITFEGLYPEDKPTITFNETEKTFGGNNSCNVYNGKFTKKENTIEFGDTIKTMRFCEGGGEETFMNMLGKVNKFAIDNEGKLLLQMNDITMMRFKNVTKNKQ